jgi:hypothetical protein
LHYLCWKHDSYMYANCIDSRYSISNISFYFLFLFWGNYIFIYIPSVDERSDRIINRNFVQNNNMYTTYIPINVFNLCQQSFLPFYIYFLKCWHRLNEPLIYYAKIVHLLCQFHAGKVGFSAVCQAMYS